MQPFHELTERGQARRLRKLAANALQQYDLDVRGIRLIAVHTNCLFRIDTAAGARYALRIGTPGEHSLADNLAEVTWLTALRRDTDLHVPIPIANRNGNPITIAEAAGVPEPRRCILFEWIPGRPLDEQITVENYAKLGAIAAKLHQHAASFQPPADFQAMRWDKAFYYPHEPVVIYEDKTVNSSRRSAWPLLRKRWRTLNPC
ncbi:MAG: phosphotransferase [Caldilineaceae bacterium]